MTQIIMTTTDFICIPFYIYANIKNPCCQRSFKILNE